MGWSPKLAVGAWVVGMQADRFMPKGYREFVPTEEKIRRVGSVPGVTGIELTFPVDFTTLKASEVAELLKQNSLAATDIGLNIFGDVRWKRGSFSNRDDSARRAAIDTALAAVEAARVIEAEGLRMWMGQDGFDYPFQVDYRRQRELLIEGFREVASAAPDLRVDIEYKLKEPRAHSLIDNASKAILFAQEVGLPNMGVIIDFGHALMSKENAAEVASLALQYDLLAGVHFNDAYGDWDDDLIPGTLNLFEALEFLCVLRQADYQGWLTLDSFPFREDPVEAVKLSIRNTQGLIEMANRIDLEALKKAQETMDAVATQEVIRKVLFAN
ncbi:MAG: TIM barrel protein [Bacillota bacterium]|nr:TIM barrel protein [Bacillota bacterium]